MSIDREDRLPHLPRFSGESGGGGLDPSWRCHGSTAYRACSRSEASVLAGSSLQRDCGRGPQALGPSLCTHDCRLCVSYFLRGGDVAILQVHRVRKGGLRYQCGSLPLHLHFSARSAAADICEENRGSSDIPHGRTIAEGSRAIVI